MKSTGEAEYTRKGALILVVGSGPAAIAAAHALAKRSANVCILDVGNRLEMDKLAVKQRLAESTPEDWRQADIETIKQGSAPTAKGLPKKYLFGSGFVYDEPTCSTPIDAVNSKVTRSFALGGLSNVWGACALPYPNSELGAWPERSRDLAAHYKAVADLMPQTGEKDALSSFLPLHSPRPGVPLISRQAVALRDDLDRHGKRLARQGIHYGAARIALRNTDNECKKCGLCLYGCPYDLIYSSSQTLPQLLEKGVTYRPGVVVNKIEEHGNTCRVTVRSAASGKIETLEVDRVFVGAGVWGTAELMLRSLDAFDTDLTMLHSDRFMLPLVRLRGTPGVTEEALTTLSQLFLELDDRHIDKHSVHLQVYTYNDMMRAALGNKLGPLARAFKWPLDQFVSRLLILFGYVHSDSSQYLKVRLGSGENGHLSVEGQQVEESRRVAWRVTARILREFKAFRALPAWPMMDPPGGGNHTGGSFPMSENPSGFQSDVWGRLSGLNRVHIVDASTLPSLPAATVVYPSMANAHRICSTCEL